MCCIIGLSFEAPGYSLAVYMHADLGMSGLFLFQLKRVSLSFPYKDTKKRREKQLKSKIIPTITDLSRPIPTYPDNES